MPWFDSPEALIVNAEPGFYVRAEVLNHNVGPFDEPLEHCEAARILQVQRHARLLRCKFWKSAP
jgi:hypothetical protein